MALPALWVLVVSILVRVSPPWFLQCNREWEVRAVCARIDGHSLTHADSDEGDHYSDLMAITIPSDADHRRSEATLSYSYHP